MEITKLKDILINNKVNFSYYRAGVLYYKIAFEGNMYEFPVPVEDVGDATFNTEDKASFFMRYIRKAIEGNAFVRSL